MTDAERERLIAANLQEYGYRYDELTFPTPVRAAAAMAERSRLLATLAGRVEVGCQGTKLDCRDLAPGCRSCVAGYWSCLFINGACNARCFYCPSPQDETGVPVTNSLAFPEPEAYLAYLERFGFTGASISGGEPLLTPARTLQYLTAIKERFGSRIHLWLYTNGTLLDRSNLRALREAGLDEIRIDIGATRYRLKKAALAAEFIPAVTVEIPAIPEDVPLLKGLLPELRASGVRHLNLHQLRLTPHNFRHLVERGYTFLHGEKVTVMESELAALEVLHHAVDAGVELPVNYCSFTYKHRYQRAAARRRAAASIQNQDQQLTAAGFLRTVDWDGPGPDSKVWLRYHEAVILPGPTGRHRSVRVPLSGQRTLTVEEQPAGEPIELTGEGRDAFLAWLAGPETSPLPPSLAVLSRWERVADGLQDYF